ncbi:OB83A protein, partial [Pseudoatta argentina]
IFNICNTIILYYILLFLFCVHIGTRADIKRECRKQTNVSWASLKQLKAGNIEQHDIKLKCYLKCFLAKNGILNENNSIDVEKVLRHLPRNLQESSRKILHRCKSIQSDNACDKAFQIATCYIKEQPDVCITIIEIYYYY